jgi:hypothetical protein
MPEINNIFVLKRVHFHSFHIRISKKDFHERQVNTLVMRVGVIPPQHINVLAIDAGDKLLKVLNF